MLYGCLPEISSNGDFYTSTDIETIIQSIWVILTTSKEDRPWAPEFGCNIFQYVYDIQDDDTKSKIQESVKSALSKWEPRISVKNVDVTYIANKFCSISISFTYNRKDFDHTFNMSEYVDAQDLSVYKLKAVKLVSS